MALKFVVLLLPCKEAITIMAVVLEDINRHNHQPMAVEDIMVDINPEEREEAINQEVLEDMHQGVKVKVAMVTPLIITTITTMIEEVVVDIEEVTMMVFNL
jgi:hypothetical protein